MTHEFEIGVRVMVTGDPEYAGKCGVVSGHVQDDPCTCCPGHIYFLNKVLLDDGCGYEVFSNGDLTLERDLK